MAIVTPSILAITPGSPIVLYLGPDHIHGVSNDLTLDVRLNIVPPQVVNAHVVLQLLDPAMYQFVNHTPTMDYYYNNIQDGQVVRPVFRVMNMSAVSIQLRLRVIANDMATPAIVNGDFQQYPVITQQNNQL